MKDKFELYAGCSIDDFLKVNKSLWKNSLYSYCNNDLDLVEDMISDGIVNILTHIDSYDSTKSQFSTWCFRIVMNASYRYHHIKKRIDYKRYDYDILSKIEYFDEDKEDDIYTYENIALMYDCIYNLKDERLKNIFIMKYIEGKKISEISEELNMNTNTVKTCLITGKKRIRNEFLKKIK